MKKAMMVVMLAILGGTLFCNGFRLFLDFNYSLGLSSFFKTEENQKDIDGNPGLETSKYRMGMGFKLGATVPLIKNFFIVPSVAVTYGHQKFDFVPDDENVNTTHKNYYFRNWAYGIDAAYTYLRLKNGWDFYVQTGLSLDSISGDEFITFEKKRYLGWQAGFGFTFHQLKNFGFHSLVFFKTLFSSEKISFAGIDAGLSYKIF